MNDQPLSELNSTANLEKLLDELGEHPERIEDIKQRVDEIFKQERTVMILDMSGFTRMTHQGQLISYLLMINQMKRLALPCIESAGGILIKAEHDNLTCLLDAVEDALKASKEITERLASANVILPSDRELYVSIGIGHGEILNVANEDIYGDEVNLASKLGEDIAEQGDILLTTAAYQQLKEPDPAFVKETLSISGIRAAFYRASASA